MSKSRGKNTTHKKKRSMTQSDKMNARRTSFATRGEHEIDTISGDKRIRGGFMNWLLGCIVDLPVFFNCCVLGVRNYWTRLVYCLFPFVLIGLLGVKIVTAGVFFQPNEAITLYPFVQDFSNCYMLCYIFFFVYFANGFFVFNYKNVVNELVKSISDSEKRNQYEKILHRIRVAFSGVSIVFVVGAFWFIRLAQKSPKVNESTEYWLDVLMNSSPLGYGFYYAVIIVAWFLSARLFIMLLINGITIYNTMILSTEINIDASKLKKYRKYIAASMGFGVYFLIAVGMIIYSDFRTWRQYQIKFGVYSNLGKVILLTVWLSVFYFSTMIMSYMSVCEKGKNLPSDGSGMTKDKIIDKDSVYAFLLTVIFPGFAALLQLLSPFSKLFAHLFR